MKPIEHAKKRNYAEELEKRTAFIQKVLAESGAAGIVYGNSGGKDSALVGILCKTACENTIGIQMPCGSKRNFNEDLQDALSVAEQFSITTKTFDLTEIKAEFLDLLHRQLGLTPAAVFNMAPRLRMATLYAAAASENALVAGTGNASEGYMGYFTKWGDGAFDFNPIADLTVTEVYEFLAFLNAPKAILEKKPSAALYEGQTDEQEMGITYARIDQFLLRGEADEADQKLIDEFHKKSEHKRRMPPVYGG
ncbi:NAD(+) synthase [Oscillospiraceae bacterium MB08-C2-2]|nr:NAD(+) synthase [Oscillospiraceae bacterium MB08-C2-2]